MAEPLKNIFSRKLVEPFAMDVHAAWPEFEKQTFLDTLFDAGWESLELKQRIRQISLVLRRFLPEDFPQALALLTRITEKYLAKHGEKMSFEYMFLPDFVEVWGLEHPAESIMALETMTRWSSAEFAVRPFLKRYPERMDAQMLEWSAHSSPMVRRLSSEGIRPRLPWGLGVPRLKIDPAPILPILENLKNDPSETVRRSVANNLNDIAKDHPELVLSIAGRWKGLSPETDALLRHACRGLLKKGHTDALSHFGFEQGLDGIQVSGLECTTEVRVGEKLEFSFILKNSGNATQRVRLEYGIDYQTQSGKTSRKVFKIKELNMAPGLEEVISRHQRFQDFTTRKHYPGLHRMRILLNGKEQVFADFEVLT